MLIWIFVFIILSSFTFAVSSYPDANPFNATRIFHLDDDCVDGTGTENCDLVGNPGYNVDTPLDSGKSLLCDGAGDALDSNFGQNDFFIQDAFSTCFWWKQVGGDANKRYFGMRRTTGDDIYYYSFHRDIGDDHELVLRHTDGVERNDLREENNDDVTGDGNWHLICYTLAAGNGAARMKIYRNGTRVDDVTDDNDGVTDVAIPFDLYYCAGNIEGSVEAEQNGHLDDILIFNGTVLTLGQIQTIFLGNYTPTDPPTNSTWNVTSDNIVSGENSTTWNGGGTINVTSNEISFTFTADVNSNWTCSTTEGNYSEQLALSVNNKLATTNTTIHAGTLADNLTIGNQCMYCSGITSNGIETASGVSSSSCLNVTGVSTVTITLSSIEGLNSSSDPVSAFDSNNLQAIETMRVNFTINSTFSNISDWRFNFTANGSSACSLGNQQDETCFNITNSAPTKWIEFINGTNTTTFDATDSGMAQGDSITPTIIQDDDANWRVSLLIDEHYNPNIAKHYPLNFSDVKFQDGVNQRITQNNIILINFSLHHDIPLDADQYKLDFRVNCSALQPNQPLDAFVCNADYLGLGISPHDANSSTCAIIAQKSCSELQDDGTKFRGIFTDLLVDEIGSIDYVVLDTFELNPNRYYILKTYADPENDTEWLFSTDEGGSFSSLGDGYESEVNFNWFYNTNKTEIIMSLFANNTENDNVTLQFNNSWDINISTKFPPIVNILSPEVNDTFISPFSVRFSAVDPNDDNLNITFTLSNSTLNLTLITDLNQSNTSFIIDNNSLSGTYNLTMFAAKIVNSSFNDSNTHEFNIIKPVILNAPLNNTIESTNNTITFNCTGTSNVTLVNMSVYFTNESNGNFALNDTNNITGTINTTTFDKLLQNGNYTWNCEVCFNNSDCYFADNNFTLTIPEINFTNQTNGNISYGVNWSLAVITNTSSGDWFDHGNFTINITESDIEIYPAVDWLFNFTNNDNVTISVSIQQNQTMPWYNWFCNSTNITTAINNFIDIDPGNSTLVNCTLNLNNAKQTYLNHNLTSDNGSFDFTHIISAVR